MNIRSAGLRKPFHIWVKVVPSGESDNLFFSNWAKICQPKSPLFHGCCHSFKSSKITVANATVVSKPKLHPNHRIRIVADAKFGIHANTRRLVINTLRPRQNGRHFPDKIFKCIFLNEDARISLKIPLKFVPKVRINNIPALLEIMSWRRLGDKPLSQPMMVSLPTHICVTRPQWVNTQIVFAGFSCN